MTQTSFLQSNCIDYAGKNVGIFMLHDFAGSTAHLETLAKQFADKGYTVKLPMLLGHGTTPEELHEYSYDDIFHHVHELFKSFFDKMDFTIVVGFAAGGAIAQQLASKYDIVGLILINSIFSPPKKIIEDAKLLQKNNESYLETGTIDIKDVRATHTIYNKVPVKLALELDKVSANLQENAPLIQSPVLILQSINDHVYSAVNADRMLNAFASREKHLVMLMDSFHYAPIDYDQQRIFNQSLFFVKGLDPHRVD